MSFHSEERSQGQVAFLFVLFISNSYNTYSRKNKYVFKIYSKRRRKCAMLSLRKFRISKIISFLNFLEPLQNILLTKKVATFLFGN